MRKPILLTLCGLSTAGLLAGLWAHVVALFGIDPQSVFQKLWIFQLLLFFVLLPLCVRVFRKGLRKNPLNLPKVEQKVLYGCLVYYAAHFYFFMLMAPEHLQASLTWKMFSAGWILLFLLSAFYYWTRYAE